MCRTSLLKKSSYGAESQKFFTVQNEKYYKSNKEGAEMGEARIGAKCSVGFLGFLVLMLVAVVMAQPAGAQEVPAADLSIQKFDFPPEQVAVGETLFYELDIANLGPGTATNAVVTDDLPSNTEFLFTISWDCTNVGNTVTCNLGDLAPNELAVVEFAVCPTEPGTATNRATASSDTLDPDPTNNTDTETTEVTTPAVGACPSQEQPPPAPEPTPPLPDNGGGMQPGSGSGSGGGTGDGGMTGGMTGGGTGGGSGQPGGMQLGNGEIRGQSQTVNQSNTQSGTAFGESGSVVNNASNTAQQCQSGSQTVSGNGNTMVNGVQCNQAINSVQAGRNAEQIVDQALDQNQSASGVH